jgi:hypothetical protein
VKLGLNQRLHSEQYVAVHIVQQIQPSQYEKGDIGLGILLGHRFGEYITRNAKENR